MNFDELVDIINNMKKINGEACLICNFPIDINITDNIMKLKCNHTYHNNCISAVKKNNTIICPYCQKITNLNKYIPLPIINKCIFIIKSGIKKGLVCNKTNCSRHNKKLPVDENKQKCIFIIKTGSKKGLVCNRNNCMIHNKIIIV